MEWRGRDWLAWPLPGKSIQGLPAGLAQLSIAVRASIGVERIYVGPGKPVEFAAWCAQRVTSSEKGQALDSRLPP